MPVIELPNNQSATILTRNEVPQRLGRVLDRSYVRAGSVAALIVEYGYDENDSTTWARALGKLTPEESDDLDAYQALLIASLVKSWTLGDLPTVDTALDLPKATFDILATACATEYNNVPDFSPDAVADPLVDTAD